MFNRQVFLKCQQEMRSERSYSVGGGTGGGVIQQLLPLCKTVVLAFDLTQERFSK